MPTYQQEIINQKARTELSSQKQKQKGDITTIHQYFEKTF
jgi:hypothetical protein